MRHRHLYGIVLFIAPALMAGQQNFINVPSAELTEKGKLFFQQQLNFNELLQSNTTLDYGFGNSMEAGITVIGLNHSRQTFLVVNDSNDRDPFSPLIAINMMKQVKWKKNFNFAIGLQAGENFTIRQNRHEAALVYGNLQIKNTPLAKSTFVAGGYFNTRHYGGSGNRFGAWLGLEVGVSSQIHWIAESILGDNALCYSSVGIAYYPAERMPITLAIQLPNTPRNAYALVFELTIIPAKPH